MTINLLSKTFNKKKLSKNEFENITKETSFLIVVHLRFLSNLEFINIKNFLSENNLKITKIKNSLNYNSFKTSDFHITPNTGFNYIIYNNKKVTNNIISIIKFLSETKLLKIQCIPLFCKCDNLYFNYDNLPLYLSIYSIKNNIFNDYIII